MATIKKIDKRLNMVIPIYGEDNDDKEAKPIAHVHSAPISTELFSAYWEPIGLVHARIFSPGGLGLMAGPRMADKVLEKVSKELGVWEGVQTGLLAAIYQLTNVFAPDQNGAWQMWQWADAKKHDIVSNDDAAAVEAALVFFTVASAMFRKYSLKAILDRAFSLWGAQTESSNSTEFLHFLRTLTVAATTGAKVTPIASSPKS